MDGDTSHNLLLLENRSQNPERYRNSRRWLWWLAFWAPIIVFLVIAHWLAVNATLLVPVEPLPETTTRQNPLP